jgi:DNA repair ATPase RecN
MANLITLGEEFKLWSHSRQIQHLHSLASSMNEALDMMQNERNELRDKNKTAEASLVAADRNLGITKNTMRTFMHKANEEKQHLEAVILKLTAERKELKRQLRILSGSNDRPTD